MRSRSIDASHAQVADVLTGVRPVLAVAVMVGLAAGATVVYFVFGNFVFSEIARAVGYGLLLWFVGVKERLGLVILGSTIVAIGIADRQRLVTEAVPAFFEGLGSRRRSL